MNADDILKDLGKVQEKKEEPDDFLETEVKLTAPAESLCRDDIEKKAEFVLSDDQERAVIDILEWANSDVPEFTLGGYAGTGKTTITSYLLSTCYDAMPPICGVLTPTGKAADVLRKKGIGMADTIHSALYRVKEKDYDEVKKKTDLTFTLLDADSRELQPGDLVVIDEASMVNQRIADDIREAQLRVLWVGDHGQLPPIGKDPGIMTNLDARLEEIHRQARGNPILAASEMIRNGVHPSVALQGKMPVFRRTSHRELVDYAVNNNVDQIIVGFNKDRSAINQLYRYKLGKEGLVAKGDRVICINNNRRAQVFNGQQFEVLDPQVSFSDKHQKPRMKITDGLREFDVMYDDDHWGYVPKDFNYGSPVCFFDHAYAITAHKSQGSEYPHVLVLNSECPGWDLRRWAYTAITRGKERVTYVV